MDIVIKFYDEEKSETVTHYYNSSFVGSATAENLLSHFKKAMKDLPLKKVIHVSMDGPHVNWKLIDLLKQELWYSEVNSPRFLEYGCCPLHVAHGALLTGHMKSGWTICATLSSAFYLLNDSPARRAEYEVVTNSSIYPQKFCRTRWVENVSVAKRFLEIFDNLKLYVENVKNSRTKALSSWQTLDKSFKDPFLKAKISFFISVAQAVEPFLRRFQTQNPMFSLLRRAFVYNVQSFEKICSSDEARNNFCEKTCVR